MSKVNIFRQSCKGVDDCGICKFVCPQDLFQACQEMNAAGYFPPEIKDESQCTGCRNCMVYCPDFAIWVEKTDDQPAEEDEDKNAG
ncbi:MAG: 4Fe-4S binding protein [Desulfobacterales bacterium]|nr:MAG: 4Fe-4S binding protein [Desulfobacterales bacterium]